ncbi:TPA: hypothetical protein NJY08_004409 [Salmonella enterica subsp. enterica serovar Typhi str. AG3]|nr:hypothetical protein [Salmonella enterica subsp. enterica serovar Typhi str. AG3]
MSIFSEIKNALNPLNIPTRRLQLSKDDEEQNYNQYIIVYFLNESGALYADDEEIETSHSIQLSLFTKLNFEETAKQIKFLLGDKGFSRTSEFESYENQTGYFHKVIRFSYTTETEEV